MIEKTRLPIRRREFLKWSAGILVSLCFGKRPAALAASPYHPIGRYRLKQLPMALQQNLKNPNLRMPVRQMAPFDYRLSYAKVPGIDYLSGGGPVRAVAAGIVHFVGERHGADPGGGLYVRVAHDLFENLQKAFYPRVTLYRYQAFRSTYYHLSEVKVRPWQTVQRGQVIGRGSVWGGAGEERFKLVLEACGNFVNPDDYGTRHEFMTYWDGSRDLELPLVQMHRRLGRQNQIVEKFNALYTNGENGSVFDFIHGYVATEKFTGYPVLWSAVERFRYLEHLYRKNPGRFKSMTDSGLAEMKEIFDNHQPITLTLPFN